MNYNLSRYARAAASIAYLCVMSAGCSKTIKPEPVVQTSGSIMPENLPVSVATTPTTYSISEIDSKTPVLPVRKKVKVVKHKTLEAKVSNTPFVSSENNQSPLRQYAGYFGIAGVFLFGLGWFLYASRRKQEPQPPQDSNGNNQ